MTPPPTKTLPLLTNSDLLTNMDTYERSLEEHTSYDVTRRLDMTTAYGAGARNVRDIYEPDRAKTREVMQALVDDLSRAYCIEKPSLSQAKLILNISPTKP